VYPDLFTKVRDKLVALSDQADHTVRMMPSGFPSERSQVTGAESSPRRATRRAKALLLLDSGWSCQEVARTFLLDDDGARLAQVV
jgi:hypothetical protein